MSRGFFIPAGTRDISRDILDADGLLRILPAQFYAGTSGHERGLAAVRNGLYGLPTIELCDWLTAHIAGRSALEIGAGHGRLAEHLGIRAVDNFMQDRPEVAALYRAQRQPRVQYGSNVEKIDALDAVIQYRPQVVIGSWITHRFDPAEAWRGGNQYGPDAKAILKLVEEYILIGHEDSHALNPLLELPHEMLFPDWLYSRVPDPASGRNFIAIWKGTP